jgi:hypothetical protein
MRTALPFPFPIQTLDFSSASGRKLLAALAEEEISREGKISRH